jgi:hypothetical protein
MLDPDRYFPQEKKLLSNIENRRAGHAFGFTPQSIHACASSASKAAACFILLRFGADERESGASQRSTFKVERRFALTPNPPQRPDEPARLFPADPVVIRATAPCAAVSVRCILGVYSHRVVQGSVYRRPCQLRSSN